MKKPTMRTIANLMLGAGVVVAGIRVAARLFAHSLSAGLATHRDDTASTYEAALAQLSQLQAQDDETINPICCTQLLTHGRKMPQAIVLIHGITNCPQQFVELAPQFYHRGYNVLIPRMPHNGLADRTTSDLRNLTAQELRDASNAYVDIAHGLGERVTLLGLSAGGTMAAWVAQHRADVDEVVLIAPMLGIGSLGPKLTVLLMGLFLLMPNIPTQHLFPFQDGPTHSYLGYSSRALVEVMRLAASVYLTARKTKPAAQSVLLVTNAGDTAVNNHVTWQLVSRWKDKGLERLEVYEFGREHHLIHDVIDPEQREQQTTLIYPVLLDLMTHEKVAQHAV
ncbi:MAG: alpha/beta fold hydrolase [Chloroflexi bacterium]|nr:alpha/beta fold hydrolase [Chloroflexota bacterium]